MTPNEKALIEDLFNRIRSTPMPQRDAEADRLIADQMLKTPGAAYVLAQTVLVQDQALREAHEKVKAAEAAQQARPMAPPQEQPMAQEQPSGSILDRIGLGNAGRGAVPRTGPMAEGGMAAGAAGPGPAAGAPADSGSGGFMRGALQTAAGVAGGALLFEGVRSMFGGGGLFGGNSAGGSFLGGGSPWGGGEPQTVVNETIINEAPDDDRDDDDRGNDAGPDVASYDDGDDDYSDDDGSDDSDYA